MSLNYDLTKIPNYKEVCFRADGGLDGVTETLIFMLVSIGIPSVTKRNFREVCQRAFLLQAVFGPWLQVRNVATGDVEAEELDHTHIRSHIGLKTNAATLTKHRFMNNMMSASNDAVSRRIRDETKLKEEHERTCA